MSEIGFQLQRYQFFMAFAGVKTTPVKKVLKPKSALSCRLCGATVTNGGYYGLTLDRTSFPASDTPEKLLKYLFENFFVILSGRKPVCWAACSLQEELSAH